MSVQHQIKIKMPEKRKINLTVVKTTGLLRIVIALLFVIGLVPTKTFAQLKKYKFEEIDSLQKVEKRTVMVFIHTDWCKYCQTMNHTTFKNKEIIEQLNKHFYLIDFNAEEKRNITFKNYQFKYKPSGATTGSHELAEQLGSVNDKISFPTLCFLNKDNEIVFQYAQYMNSKVLMIALARLK